MMHGGGVVPILRGVLLCAVLATSARQAPLLQEVAGLNPRGAPPGGYRQGRSKVVCRATKQCRKDVLPSPACESPVLISDLEGRGERGRGSSPLSKAAELSSWGLLRLRGAGQEGTRDADLPAENSPAEEGTAEHIAAFEKLLSEEDESRRAGTMKEVASLAEQGAALLQSWESFIQRVIVPPTASQTPVRTTRAARTTSPGAPGAAARPAAHAPGRIKALHEACTELFDWKGATGGTLLEMAVAGTPIAPRAPPAVAPHSPTPVPHASTRRGPHAPPPLPRTK
jgi:hypothetical protein